jgi:hypothetical protein
MLPASSKNGAEARPAKIWRGTVTYGDHPFRVKNDFPVLNCSSKSRAIPRGHRKPLHSPFEPSALIWSRSAETRDPDTGFPATAEPAAFMESP